MYLDYIKAKPQRHEDTKAQRYIYSQPTHQKKTKPYRKIQYGFVFYFRIAATQSFR